MALKKHHKIVIGGFSTLLIALLIANSVFIYILYGQLQLSYNNLNSEIETFRDDTQLSLNELSGSILDTQGDLQTLEQELGTISAEFDDLDEEFSELKATTSADFSDIIEDAVKGVVTIRTDVGQGSGFLITSNGYIVTNYHVMEDAKAATIITYEGDQHSVALIGHNEEMDITLLKIEGTFEELEIGDSDDVSVGEKVIAIGNPYGLSFSVSEGIVSALHREGDNGYNVYIQTDAALNSGNSGGPLIDKNGEVIGVNNFKIENGESLGFALESNTMKEVVNDIYYSAKGEELI